MFFLGSSSYSTNNPNASAAERGELLWDRERERIKKKEKEKEIAAKMAVSINELISCVQFDLIILTLIVIFNISLIRFQVEQEKS